MKTFNKNRIHQKYEERETYSNAEVECLHLNKEEILSGKRLNGSEKEKMMTSTIQLAYDKTVEKQ
jgi:hypothetical protein